MTEKSLKLFVSVSTKTQTALSTARSDFAHNIEKLRAACAQIDSVFDEAPIKDFSRDLNEKAGKLYQYVRYGSEETTEGFDADLAKVAPVIDRIFVQGVLKLPERERKLLFFVSPLKHLVRGSSFDQTRNRTLVLEALRYQNKEFPAFEALCEAMDREHDALMKTLASTSGTRKPEA